METKVKLKIVDYWLKNMEKFGDVPDDLKDKVTKKDLEYLVSSIGSGQIDISDISDFKRKLESDILREKELGKQKLVFFKDWVYPILAPILVAVIITLLTNNILNPTPIIDIVARDYYDIPASTDVNLEFFIKNPNQYKITVHNPISYRFTWSDYNPKGNAFIPIAVPKIEPVINDSQINQVQNEINNEIILNSAGREGDSVRLYVKFRSPPTTDKIQILTIIVNTEKDEVIKEIRLNVVETKTK